MAAVASDSAWIDSNVNRPVRWIADLSPVREVSLLGTANLAYWTNRLRGEGLVLAEKDGKAQILAIAADMKFKGVRFQELSFSVLVLPPHIGLGQNAAFLLHAFNSNRLFAFCERAFFSTPYQHGRVEIATSLPCEIRLFIGDKTLFHAAMHLESLSQNRSPARHQVECWNGPIYLPATRSGKPGGVFVGKLLGDTRTYPFIPGQDALALESSAGIEVLRALRESEFSTAEWIVRENARHAKSKTYRRSDL